jgi:hypothetical protein
MSSHSIETCRNTNTKSYIHYLVLFLHLLITYDFQLTSFIMLDYLVLNLVITRVYLKTLLHHFNHLTLLFNIEYYAVSY